MGKISYNKFMGILAESKTYLKYFLSYLEVERNFSSHTIRAYGADITAFLIWLDGKHLEDIKYSNVKEYLLFIYKFNYSKTTLARKISAIRTFYKYLYREKITDSNPVVGINSPKRQKKLPEVLSEQEIEQILNQVDISTPAGFRNRTILELLYATGMRISELCSLTYQNLNLDNDEITVFGKGQKERIVLVSKRAKNFLEDYLKTARNLIAKGYEVSQNQDSPLFINNTGFKLQPQTVRMVLKKIMNNLELPKHVTPHKFRHSFATKMLDNGADLRIVQELLGHASITNTQIYTHVTSQKLQQTYELSHPRAK